MPSCNVGEVKSSKQNAASRIIFFIRYILQYSNKFWQTKFWADIKIMGEQYFRHLKNDVVENDLFTKFVYSDTSLVENKF